MTVSGAGAGTAPMLYTPAMIAVLYDVHGNAAALDAVLADALAAGADQWVLGGDYALFGAWPAETLGRLRDLAPAVWVRGNVDRWVGDPAAGPDDAGVQEAIADCRGVLGAAVADELGALAFEAEVAGARIVHASPISDLRSFAPSLTTTRPSWSTARPSRVWCSATRTSSSGARAASPISSSSTPARSACRSTATRARPTR